MEEGGEMDGWMMDRWRDGRRDGWWLMDGGRDGGTDGWMQDSLTDGGRNEGLQSLCPLSN